MRLETKIEAIYSMVRREVENVFSKVANVIIKDRKLSRGNNFDNNDDDDDAFKLFTILSNELSMWLRVKGKKWSKFQFG